MDEIMIDIETMSVLPNALILTIGAIKFKRKGQLQTMDKLDKFYRRIDVNTCKEGEYHICEETLKWWDTQPDEAKEESFKKERIPLIDVLKELSIFIGEKSIVWANSPSFDCIIMENAYRNCKLKVPWNFWNTRDCRTIMDFGNVRMSELPVENLHHALYDCYRQIIGVKRALKNLKI